MPPRNQNSNLFFGGANTHWRLQVWYGLLLAILSIFIIRLFFLQIISHDHYRRAALSGQLKQYSIPAERGSIVAHDGDNLVPLVLNEKLYTVFADPTFIKQVDQQAAALAGILGGKPSDYAAKLRTPDTRYVILANKISDVQRRSVENLKFKGIGTRQEEYRTYPQGSLAAQVLGFVNNDGKGRYGVEESLNDQLKGQDGLLKAITDASGVPLVANQDNIQIDPVAGKEVVLTIDLAMQRQLEDILKQGLDNAKSQSGSALIIDPNTGAIKAVANYPSFNPAEFYKETDASHFSNAVFSSPLEPGSIMKPFTAAAALEQGVITPNSSFYDPAILHIDGATVSNIEEDGGGGNRSVKDILQLSLNTGAVWMLSQMGGGDLNLKARQTWADYLVNHYQFNKKTGVESYEEKGFIPNPTTGSGLNIQYANTSFGQGMSATILQLGAAMSAMVNGGVYFKPHLVDELVAPSGSQTVTKPVVVKDNVVSPQVSDSVRSLMSYVVQKNNPVAVRAGYQVGGKTGTAQIPKPTGGYYDNKYNGTYIGFTGGQKPAYVIVVRVNEPKIGGYAGTKAAAPIFAALSNMLIDNFGVTPSG